jgi:hypothetical protein
MAFSHTMGGTTFTQANFEGNAYSDEATGFPKAMEKMVEHVANAYRGTSTTSNAVGTGSKTWTVTNANSQIPAFAVGMPVRVARTAAPTTTYMQGEVTAFTASTGSTTVNVSSSLGSGTHTDWTITIGGHQTTASASPLAIADGGTGAGTAGAALTALGGATDGANSDITSLTGLTTSLTVAQGGTGAATHTSNNVLVGAGTGAVTSVAPSTSGNVLTSNGTVWASTAVAGGGKLLQIVAAQSTSSTTVALGAGPSSYPWWTTGLTCAITPASASNKIHAIFCGDIGGATEASGSGNTACAIGLAGLDGGSGFHYGTAISTAAFTLIHPHMYAYVYDLGDATGNWFWNCTLHGLTVAGTTSAITYEVYMAPVYGTSARAVWGNAASSAASGPGKLILMEIEA